MFLGTVPDAAVLAAHLIAHRYDPLQETLTGLVEGFRRTIAKQFLCTLVPGTNLTLIGYGERGVGRSLQQLK
jgi:hypothetical protein